MTAADGVPAGVSPRRASLVLVVTMLGTLMVFSSTTSVNVALPAIAASLQPGPGVADWYLLASMLAMSATILVFARISDYVGRRHIYIAGVALMTLASIGCAVAADSAMLIALRAAQGVGAAIVITNATALVADVFTGGRRSAALGMNVMGASVAGAVGPVLGGWLVSSFGWPSVFLINVPFGVAGVLLGTLVIPKVRSERESGERFDYGGAVLSVLVLFSLLFAINRVSAWGIADWRVIAFFALAVISFLAFALVESIHKSPLVDFSIIRRGRRYFAYGAVFFISVPQTTLPVVIVLYEQLVLGTSATSAGLIIIPFAIVVAVTAPITGRLASRFSPHTLPVIGGIVMSLGLGLMLVYFTAGASPVVILIALVVAGFGNGLFHTPNLSAIMSGIASNRFGVAGGVRSVLFNSAQSIGTAVVLLLLGYWFTQAGGSGLAEAVSDNSAVQPGFVIVVALMIACALASSTMSALASTRRGPARPITSHPTLAPSTDRNLP